MKPAHVVLAASAVLLAGCVGGDPAPDGEASTASALGGPGETVEIGMTDGLAFEPEEITIRKGTRVVWTNVGGQHNHDVTHDADTPAFKSYDKSFEAGNLEPGEAYEHTFTEVGTFPYYCKWHGKSSMAAILHVVA